MYDKNNRFQKLLEYRHTFQCSNYTILAFATIHTLVLVKVIGIANDIVHNTLNINFYKTKLEHWQVIHVC